MNSNSKSNSKSNPSSFGNLTEKDPISFEFENLDGGVEKIELNDAWLIAGGGCGGSGDGGGFSLSGGTPKGSSAASGKACGSGA